MNYLKHYERLIERAQARSIMPGEYFESHHIVPKCLGGTNDSSNLVKLFPEEHYVAHQLLVKMHPHDDKILSAAIVMGGKKKGREQCNNKIYGWLKKRMSKSRKGKPGHPRSEETRRKMSESQKKVIRGPLSKESIMKRTETRKLKGSGKIRKPRNEESRLKASALSLSKPYLKCPHCSMESRNANNMKRFTSISVNLLLIVINRSTVWRRNDIIHAPVPGCIYSVIGICPIYAIECVLR